MTPFITQNTFYHIKNLTLVVFLLLPVGCNDKNEHPEAEVSTAQSSNGSQKAQTSDRYHIIRKVSLSLPSGKLIDTKLAITQQEQTIGLSGSKPESMTKYEGLLFFYLKDGSRQFWMPNTLFEIHIIFLDKNLKVIGIEKNVPYHPGRQEPPAIYRTRSYFARHVLEIRADSPLGEELELGTQLGWISKISLLETESYIRQPQ
ncbi:MAG: DUF192 domain-containing protein [Bacteriovoracaceae bacterium]|jgi:uncharacterized protein|nr:DUF192 domain-containing protein [Bacteriovoracaceae bacterium]